MAAPPRVTITKAEEAAIRGWVSEGTEKDLRRALTGILGKIDKVRAKAEVATGSPGFPLPRFLELLRTCPKVAIPSEAPPSYWASLNKRLGELGGAVTEESIAALVTWLPRQGWVTSLLTPQGLLAKWPEWVARSSGGPAPTTGPVALTFDD